MKLLGQKAGPIQGELEQHYSCAHSSSASLWDGVEARRRCAEAQEECLEGTALLGRLRVLESGQAGAHSLLSPRTRRCAHYCWTLGNCERETLQVTLHKNLLLLKKTEIFLNQFEFDSN